MTAFRKLLIAVTGVTCAFSVGCGGGSSTSTKTNTVASSGQNVAPIAVNAGPAGNYANGAFASVTVCVPGSSTCQTIDGVLVDTGSSGLRILSSALTLALPQQNTSGGNPVVECLPFLGSYTWGPVQTADVKMAGEKASAVPIQVLSDTDFKVAERCAGFGLPSANTVDSLGANGILGIGVFEQDCGDACVQNGSSNPGLYYECATSSSCSQTGEALAQQVQNPVALFSSDNNGVIIEFPAVSAPAATVSGSLVFGIGTQSNNGLGGATVYTVDGATASFTSSYKGVSHPIKSFIDSGSNGYFFLDSGLTSLPDCSVDQGFYCPSTPQALTATNHGVNGTSGTVNFTIANAEALFAHSADTVFGELGGPDTFPGTQSQNYFDWGLPFFYGRNVYTAIETKSTPGGTGPYWAY
jgi:uncharacterized protein DUF3443